MAANQRSSGSAPSPASARTAALTLASRRDYTAAELESRLHDNGYDAAAIADALADLRARRVIDDARVAAAHVRTATAVKGRGRVRIARELAARGVAANVIADAVGAIDRGDELASIRRILGRKRFPAKPTLAERQRMFRHLLGRGFPTDLIIRALGGRVSDPDEEP